MAAHNQQLSSTFADEIDEASRPSENALSTRQRPKSLALRSHALASADNVNVAIRQNQKMRSVEIKRASCYLTSTATC